MAVDAICVLLLGVAILMVMEATCTLNYWFSLDLT